MRQSNLPAFAADPPLFSHLDPLETPVNQNSTRPFADDLAAGFRLRPSFRHSGWHADRAAIWQAMQDLNLRSARLESFRQCGNSFWVQQHVTDQGRYRLVADHCHDRLCLPCAQSRQSTIRLNAETLVGERRHRFLTLTIRSTGQPLRLMLNHLYTSFRKFRQRSLWKQRVFGGVAFTDITWHAAGTYSPNGRLREQDEWHPHLHCILDGHYMDLYDLRRAWLAVTGDSFGLKIREIRDKRTVVHYVTKYATKPLPREIIRHPEALREAIESLKRRRLLLTFGTWRRFKFLEHPSDVHWKRYDHLTSIELMAREGHLLSVNILAMMHTADPITGEFEVVVDGPPLDDSS